VALGLEFLQNRAPVAAITVAMIRYHEINAMPGCLEFPRQVDETHRGSVPQADGNIEICDPKNRKGFSQGWGERWPASPTTIAIITFPVNGALAA
jgi:hypothetical protein